MNKNVITRIAPSPTGYLHIGVARTALFNYLYAKQHKGTFILRFEDTDTERSSDIYQNDAHNALMWLGLHPDMVIRQSSRTPLYKKRIAELLKNGSAYVSTEKARDDIDKEVNLIRFKNHNKPISFYDSIRGEITIDISDLGDFVIAKSFSEPLYNLAVVIDDIDMNITDVIRGDDHIANTPRQILLFQAFNKTAPKFTHIPLIHSKDGGKLSKRKDAASINEFREKGYLANALLNYIALLGWSSKEKREIYSLQELISMFSIDGLQKKEALYDENKLDWYNQQYIRKLPNATLLRYVFPALRIRFSFWVLLRSTRTTKLLLQELRERYTTISAIHTAIIQGEYDFYYITPSLESTMLVGQSGETKDMVCNHLKKVQRILEEVGVWNKETIYTSLMSYAEVKGKKSVLWPLRVALSGKEKSPDIFSIVMALGKKETQKRISNAIKALDGV